MPITKKKPMPEKPVNKPAANITQLTGEKPGAWCPAYAKSKDRRLCQERNCRYYQEHRVTPVIPEGENVEAYDENFNALSIKKPKVFLGKEFFVIHEKCGFHCVKYDEPSKMVDLPWDLV